MKDYLWIGMGSALGGMGRYWLSGMIANRYGAGFPWGTILVNVSGSFLIGLMGALTETGGRFLAPPAAREFVMLGILGGYTTFSSFSLQTLNLAREGQWLYACANIGLSLVLCLAAVWLGYVAGQFMNR